MKQEEKEAIIISVFFGGINCNFKERNTLVEEFGIHTTAVDPINDPIFEHSNHYKFCFDGCGKTDGWMGFLFGAGLDFQCETVVWFIKSLPKDKMSKIVINTVGFSRGGLACILLAQKIEYEFKELDIHVNLMLIDPIPGNLITLAKFDLFGFTWTGRSLDLSKLLKLKSVVAIYPHGIPNLSFHAPIIPIYGKHTHVTEEVILGWHVSAVRKIPSLETKISAFFMKDFLIRNGTKLTEDLRGFNKWKQFYDIDPIILLDEMNSHCSDEDHQSSIRYTHSLKNKKILYKPSGKYLNQLHHYLSADMNPSIPEEDFFLCFTQK